MSKEVNLSLYKKTLDVGAGRLKQVLWYFTNMLIFNSYGFPFSSAKLVILRFFGAKIGRNVVIKPSVNIKFPWKLSIGDNSWIGEQVWIDNLAEVKIGKNVVLSQGSMLLSGNHNYKKESFDLITSPIVIDDGVWIGAKATVAGGVHCASHSILSVNSFTAQNLDAYGIYIGNPALWKRNRKIE